MRFRQPKFDWTFDRPSNCLGIRSFLLTGWYFQAGFIQHIGFRVCGVTLEAEWRWMTEAQEQEWLQLKRDEQALEQDYELEEEENDE